MQEILDKEGERVMFRAKINRVVKDEKCSKYFHGQIKDNHKRSNINSLNIEGETTEDPDKIEKELSQFYEELYRKREVDPNCEDWLEQLPSINLEQKNKLDKEFTMNEVSNVVLKSMHQGKSPGNDGLTLGIYILAWKFIKKFVLKSFRESIKIGELSAPQRQSVIRLIEKKGKDKKYITRGNCLSEPC